MSEREAEHELFVSVAVPRPLPGLFTYSVPEKMRGSLRVGGWVRVPFGRSVTHAYLVEEPKGAESLPSGLLGAGVKPLLEVGAESMSPALLQLCQWAARFYASPIGEVLNCALPGALLKPPGKRTSPLENPVSASIARHALTVEQEAALAGILCAAPGPALLHGITGSGKTEVYLELASRALADGKGVLFLVPEIALTPQLHSRIQSGLGVPVALWHSAVADGRRRHDWRALLDGEIRAVVGARSAVFAPIRDLGLIVVDEEHDPTYKQEDRVRYHARDLALVRGKIEGCQVVLGSATPSLEARERAREGKLASARLLERPTGGALPVVEAVDLREATRVEGVRAPLAEETLSALRGCLGSGEQAILYLNRRGFASFLVCEDCGETPGCASCSLSLTAHSGGTILRCHVCGASGPAPLACAKCGGSKLAPIGSGTEGLAEAIPSLLPEARVLRLDRDVITSASRLEKAIERFRSGEANLLVGTQMLVKGHDFPGVTLVVVILADALFRWPDFRASERALQILTQVSGRAGRGSRPGRVLIQTFSPDHPVIRVACGLEDPDSMLASERELRRELSYPPFSRLARIRVEGASTAEARERAEALASIVSQIPGVEALGPSEAFLEKAKGLFRWDLLVKSPRIEALHAAIGAARGASVPAPGKRPTWNLLVDVDPYGA